VDNETHALRCEKAPQSPGKALSNVEHRVGEILGEIGKLVDVLLRDHEKLPSADGPDVHEGEDAPVLVHDAGRR
jgi:hypothetical protein